MLTVDFNRFTLGPGMTVLDVGCGQGRHSFEALRRGADVTAFDFSQSDLDEVQTMFDAMAAEGQVPASGAYRTVQGDARAMPFDDSSFERVIASEVLEHIVEDDAAIDEIVRVTKPGGLVAVTVPRYWPEKICWALSTPYHEVEGGHVRINKASELVGKLEKRGLMTLGTHHAHALHSPYWWLKCAVGVDNDTNPAVKAYHRVLVWDMMKAPALTRQAEKALNPVMGKSFVVYLQKQY